MFYIDPGAIIHLWWSCSILLNIIVQCFSRSLNLYISFHLPVVCHSYLLWDISRYVFWMFLNISIQYLSICLNLYILFHLAVGSYPFAILIICWLLLNISWYSCSIYLNYLCMPQPLHIIPSHPFAILICCWIFLNIIVKYFLRSLFNSSDHQTTKKYGHMKIKN